MERINTINPPRVAWCCADLGLTPEQVAAESGLALDKLRAVLTDEGGLTFAQLRMLAE